MQVAISFLGGTVHKPQYPVVNNQRSSHPVSFDITFPEKKTMYFSSLFFPLYVKLHCVLIILVQVWVHKSSRPLIPVSAYPVVMEHHAYPVGQRVTIASAEMVTVEITATMQLVRKDQKTLIHTNLLRYAVLKFRCKSKNFQLIHETASFDGFCYILTFKQSQFFKL